MIPALPSPLTRTDRRLLAVTQWLVPANDREDWVRSWQAELWYRSHQRNSRPVPALLFGVIQDALWLRTETLSRALTGTPTLCILLLVCLLVLATIPAIVVAGSLHAFALMLVANLTRIAAESSLVAFVSIAAAVTSLEENLSIRIVFALTPDCFSWRRWCSSFCFPGLSALISPGPFVRFSPSPRSSCKICCS